MVRRNRRSHPSKQIKTHYAVFTEGQVTEPLYLELLRQYLRPKYATFSIHAIGGEPSKVLKEYRKARQCEDFDRAILIIDVDQHDKLDETLRECKSCTDVDAVVSSPCFELWLLWHAIDRRGHVETHECVKLTRSHNLTKDKALTAKFPIESIDEAMTRARDAWPNPTPNEKGPNPSSAMPWFIDLLLTPPKES